MTRWATVSGGLKFPAEPDALRVGGAEFLTAAMRDFGTLPPDNEVVTVNRFQECAGGSTGRKAMLDVTYRRPGPPTELFVKFSRDFDNPRRDRGRSQMDLEVRFAELSAQTRLPVAVPVCVFAAYQDATCTGILVTERIGYESGCIERHYDKCLDYSMPDALGHYEALLSSVARLAGAHRAGALPASIDDRFRFDAEKVGVGKQVRRSDAQHRARARRLVEFADGHRRLLPDAVRRPDFVQRMLTDVSRIAAAEDTVMAWLHDTDSHAALCHWNANVDNAWFWRDDLGRLQCGLMDWGCVSVMNVAMALWGALCSAETSLWSAHLDHLLEHFAAEFAAAGGPPLDRDLLRNQLLLYAAVMGVAWLLDTPEVVHAAVPDLSRETDRYDPRISADESVRAPLLMLSNVLWLWDTEEFGALLDRVPER